MITSSALPPEPAVFMRRNNLYKAKEQGINDNILVVVKVVKVVSWTIIYVTLFSMILFYYYTNLSPVLGEVAIDNGALSCLTVALKFRSFCHRQAAAYHIDSSQASCA